VVYRQSLIFLHLSHFSQKTKPISLFEIDFVSGLRSRFATPFLRGAGKTK